MFREKNLWCYFGLARISEMKWMVLIYTRRSLRVWMRVGGYLQIEMDEVGIQNVTGVLFMEYNDGQQKLVAFLSKFLNKIKINYEIYDKKMLAVIKGLEN